MALGGKELEQGDPVVVPLARSSHISCGKGVACFEFKSGTGRIRLLVSLRFRSTRRTMRRPLPAWR
jgi:hypothetical protein